MWNLMVSDDKHDSLDNIYSYYKDFEELEKQQLRSSLITTYLSVVNFCDTITMFEQKFEQCSWCEFDVALIHKEKKPRL